MSTTIGSESVDRQRQRAQRGIGASGSGSAGSRLPSAPRRRRPAIAALAALLIVGGALAAGLLAVRMDEREAVIQVSKEIAVGQKITEKDLAEARVAGDSIETIKVSDARAVIGQYAAVNIKPGQLLVKGMFNATEPIQDRQGRRRHRARAGPGALRRLAARRPGRARPARPGRHPSRLDR